MANNLRQFEKNVQSSFGYVKKDLLMINDAISDVHEKIQHLSMNHASLLNQITKIMERLEHLESDRVKPSKAKKAKKPSKAKKAKKAKKVVKETITYS